MFILHIALQGCLKSGTVDYGITPDTGGHIRYVLELCAAQKKLGVNKQLIATRSFCDPNLGPQFERATEEISEGVSVLRVDDGVESYLPKEELHRVTGTFADRLIDMIQGGETKPDLIHAHYADAGIVAMEIKRRLGIPFQFTGHSLGRVKAAALANPGCEDLRRRIEREDKVIAAADRIVASSRDEAEHQYSLYPGNRPEKIFLNPPGCDLDAFGKEPSEAELEEVEDSIGRFLTDPEKPPILAVARPVAKKNLEYLLHAFGASEELRDGANLVIFAGVRKDIEELDDEGREVMERLLYLIDLYDLYGSVALPKHHRVQSVPAIYHWAAAKGGLFANPALNEPFGLTILEAAASGLPVLATRNGGPVDIVGKLKNGRLIDPHRPQDLTKAAIDLLDQPREWQAARRNGLEGIGFYSWSRHAEEALTDLRGILRPKAPRLAFAVPRPNLIVSDIDDTLVGERKSLEAFASWRAANRGFHFAIATGRSLQDAMRVLREWQAPLPEVLITSVGSEIYYSRDLDLRHLEADRDWSRMIDRDWSGDVICEVLESTKGLRLQPPCEQRQHKISYYVDRPGLALTVKRMLADASLAATVICSHGNYLDILPRKASKGQALKWVAKKLRIPISSTIAAGDSGNDEDLLLTAGTGVIVGNHRSELDCLRGRTNTYFAEQSYAGGILEALRRYQQ
jgi:sucrose-phosphate synthase